MNIQTPVSEEITTTDRRTAKAKRGKAPESDPSSNRLEGKATFAIVNCDTGETIGLFHSWNNGKTTFTGHLDQACRDSLASTSDLFG